MGQYYKIIILSEVKHTPEIIRIWICPSTYGQGMKLMEHSYINNPTLRAIEELLSPSGMFYKACIVWAGDYAHVEDSTQKNLYNMANNEPFYCQPGKTTYKYLMNHTKMEYVDMTKLSTAIHPLPLLVSEGNGNGGGDYSGVNEELCGKWARDIISFDNNILENYKELVPFFE